MRLFVAALCVVAASVVVVVRGEYDPDEELDDGEVGNVEFAEAQRRFDLGEYEAAPQHYWNAIMNRPEATDPEYTIEYAFQQFMRCYQRLNRPADGYAFVANEYSGRSSYKEAKMYAEAALAIDPHHKDAQSVLFLADEEFGMIKRKKKERSRRRRRPRYDEEEDDDDDPYDTPRTSPAKKSDAPSSSSSAVVTPESLYGEASDHFANKRMTAAAAKNQEACDLSERKLRPACANAAYCRTNVADWGPDGATYEADMAMLRRILTQEIRNMRRVDEATGEVRWNRFTSVHPHMMLGYAIDDGVMKRRVAESYALTDAYYGVAEVTGPNDWRAALRGYPLDQSSDKRDKYREDAKRSDFRIKVGYLGVGFNSKAVMFLAQDVFRYHDRSRFETHALSTGSPDHPRFLEVTMRGVDWRKRVKRHADYFHDLRDVRERGPTAVADYIANLGIHILVDWDGYARQGERNQGLYFLRPAPVQIMHQEFLGTHGGSFDYVVTDRTVSPERLEHHYSEKFLYMPHHFFCKGHREQAEVHPPTLRHAPATPHRAPGTGSPRENKCGVQNDYLRVDFVYCNFNKFLKFNPETVRAWLRVMQRVPRSQLCLLAYPSEGVANLLRFVNEFDADLVDRVAFLKWENNPFDHQRRNFDLCDAVLDSHPYNSHTTGMDAAYAALPIVTRSDGSEMGSRVNTSANKVLGVPELNAVNGVGQYEEIAVRLGNDAAFFENVRTRLVEHALAGNDETGERKHPFWDMERYTRNLERGMEIAWNRYLKGEEPEHIYVEDAYGGTSPHDEDEDEDDEEWRKEL